MHINAQEMLAALYGIKTFAKDRSHVHILLLSDNVTVVTYINHPGGTRSKLLVQLVKVLWEWCLERHIIITAQHLPGLQNVQADFMSRHLTDRTDWILNPWIFNILNIWWGPFTTDLFATWLSTQLPHFFSWRPNLEALATDALFQDWQHLRGFVHPPWCLIGRVLQKVRFQGVTLTLIAPVWPSQAWYPSLLLLLVDFPVLLPQGPATIIPSPNCPCPMQDNSPQLAAWKVSGNSSL